MTQRSRLRCEAELRRKRCRLAMMESPRRPMVDLEGGGQPEAVDAAAGRPVHMDTTAVQLQVLPARQSDLRRWQSEEFERLDLGRCEQISGGGRLFVMICSLKRSAQLRGSHRSHSRSLYFKGSAMTAAGTMAGELARRACACKRSLWWKLYSYI